MNPGKYIFTYLVVARGATDVPTIPAGMERRVGTNSITARTGEPNASVLQVYRAGSVKETYLARINHAKTKALVVTIPKQTDMYVRVHLPARVSTAKRSSPRAE